MAKASQEIQVAEPEWLRKLAQLSSPPGYPTELAPATSLNLFEPLSDDEVQELDRLLLNLDSDDVMLLDMLDGFLYAIAIGPEAVIPSLWLPMALGGKGTRPPVDSEEALDHLLGLVMRHYNSILSGLEQTPRLAAPIWGATEYDIGIFEDAEMWAYGFCEGVKLNRAAWQPLLSDPEGKRSYRPIGLLGEQHFSPNQGKLIRMPAQRQALAQQIPQALLDIHAFWLSHLHGVNVHSPVQRISPKVGRNDPCPCGSGKKYKKCCGGASEQL